MKILITNDDGVDSPFAIPLLNILKTYGDVTAVFPLYDQSWKSKSMTRFGELSYELREIHGSKIHVINGTPADCANIGIHHLCNEKPDLVISGINIGANAGLSYFWSSGTVAACIEANLSEVPGLALSQVFFDEDFNLYKNTGKFFEKVLQGYLKSIPSILSRLMPIVVNNLLHSYITWNVNIPPFLDSEFEIKWASMAPTLYHSLFIREKEGFIHNLNGLKGEVPIGSDISVLDSGNISLSKIDVWNGLNCTSQEMGACEKD